MNNLESLEKIVSHLLEESDRERKSLLNEDKNLLRSFIRHCIHEVKLETKSNRKKEDILRNYIKVILNEAEATGGAPEAPADITAMNFLKNLLKNIVPNIEENYKELTSTKKQRISFRRHTLNAVENLLNNLDADPESIDSDEELEEITLSIDKSEKPDGFIDIYDDEPVEKDDEEDLSPEQEFSKGLEGRELDKTGRNAAFESFKKIQNQIENEYSKLDADAVIEGRDETEREIFEPQPRRAHNTFRG